MNEHDVITRLATFPDDDVTLHVDVDAAIASVKLHRKRRRYIAAAVLSTIALVTGILVVTSQLDRSSPPINVAAWTVNSPAIEDAFLPDIAAISPSDVWAVGFHRLLPDATGLAMHWDGTKWQRFDLPKGYLFSGVAAVASDDVWAVGAVETGEGNSSIRKPVAMHWDGHSWRELPVPSKGTQSDLDAVVAVSTGDVWAIGNAPQTGHPFIVHWNGHEWQETATPTVPGATDMLLRSISAAGANDIWVVGMSNAAPGERPLSLHWDGHQWSAVPVTDQGGDLVDVLALSSNEVWAVGRGEPFRWDGTQWHSAPMPAGVKGQYMTLAPDGTGGVLAAGRDLVDCPNPQCDPKPTQSRPRVARWDGSTWTLIPPPTNTPGYIHSLASTPNSSLIWAVGGLVDTRTLLTASISLP